MKLTDLPQVETLSISEKMLLVEELWDAIANEPNAVPSPSWHAQALAEDAADYRAGATQGSEWSDVKRRITGQG